MTSVLVFNWRDIRNPRAGGAELYTHEVFSRLIKKFGYKVTLFTSSFEGAIPNDRIDEIEIVRSGGKYSVYREARKFYDDRKEEFDIVIDEINTRPFLTPKFVKSKPIVALIHQLAREYWWYQTRFPMNVVGFYFLENRWLKNYLDIPTVTVSESTRAELVAMGFRRVSLIQNGVSMAPSEHLAEKAEPFTSVFLARLTKVKRPEDAIKAFLRSKTSRRSRLIVVGDGELLEGLSRKYANDKVIFLGRIGDGRKLKVLQESHIHLAPYLKEGWSNTVMEAAAAGTPSIGYATSGLVDSIIDGKTGFLVPRFEIGQLSSKIDFLAENPNVLREMAVNCLNWAKSFSWDESAGNFHDVIEGELRGGESRQSHVPYPDPEIPER